MRNSWTIWLTFCVIAAHAQQGDSILASERSIDRPITVHKGQFRITGTYQFASITREFDDAGSVVKLRDQGLASVRHQLDFELKYGVNDLIQLYAAMRHSSQNSRGQTTIIFPVFTAVEPTIYQTYLSEYKGWSDLTLAVDFRAPFSRQFDATLTLGGSVPTAASDPGAPTHSITFDSATPEYDVKYQNHYKMGNGVPVGWVGGMTKYRTKHWAISARLDYRHGLKDGQSYDWQYQLIDYQTFVYQQVPYTYRLADTFNFYTEFEYQALPWLDVFVNVSGYQSVNGWHTTGPDKVATPDASLYSVNPGLELIVTPRFWVRQRFQLPVAGKNSESPYTFYASVSYNIFPFEK